LSSCAAAAEDWAKELEDGTSRLREERSDAEQASGQGNDDDK